MGVNVGVDCELGIAFCLGFEIDVAAVVLKVGVGVGFHLDFWCWL